jgi:hypothetical protein
MQSVVLAETFKYYYLLFAPQALAFDAVTSTPKHSRYGLRGGVPPARKIKRFATKARRTRRRANKKKSECG